MKSYINRKKTDPVCGKKIDPDRTEHMAVSSAHSYYFCSQRCLERFHQDSERFTRAAHRGLKGIWSRYIDRVQKATDGKPPCCH